MPKAMTGRRSGGFGCAVVLVGAVFLGCLAATAVVALGPLARVIRAQGWAAAQCTILSSALRQHRGDTATYDVDVRYRWSFGGQTFEGTRYELFGAWTSDRARWQRIADELTPGASVGCWIDPRRPSEATLVRAVGVVDVLMMLIPVGIAALAGLGLRALFRKGLPGVTSRPWPLPALVTDAGPVVLAPTSTPGARFAGALFGAVLWNAIVWLGLAGPALRSSGGRHALFQLLFAVFALVGVYLAYRAVRALAALAAPRVRVTASARQIGVGERLSIDWTFRGRADAISAVAVALIGSEIARRRESDPGTGSSTTRQVREFARHPFASAPAAGGAAGSGSVVIPSDTVPTFVASSNEIRWAIVVEASLRHLPDLREAFPVILLPKTR